MITRAKLVPSFSFLFFSFSSYFYIRGYFLPLRHMPFPCPFTSGKYKFHIRSLSHTHTHTSIIRQQMFPLCFGASKPSSKVYQEMKCRRNWISLSLSLSLSLSAFFPLLLFFGLSFQNQFESKQKSQLK